MNTIKSPAMMLIFLFICHTGVNSQEKKEDSFPMEKGKLSGCTIKLKTSPVLIKPVEFDRMNYLHPRLKSLPELPDITSGKSLPGPEKSNPLIDNSLTKLTELPSHHLVKISDSFRFRWVVENAPPEYVTRNYYFNPKASPKTTLSSKEWYRTSGFIFNEVMRTKYPRLPSPLQ